MSQPATHYPFDDPLGVPWLLEARKYDQRLHYRIPAHLISDDGHLLRFRSMIGAPLEHFTRGWVRPMNHPSEMWFWRDRWYNIYVNYDAAGVLDHFYCNAGLPPVISGTTLTFVDLDLDVQIRPRGGFEVLDTDEFIEHSAHYGYPPDVRHNAALAVLDIIQLWRSRQPPFAPES
jgi:protein associated with RNAse G/E